MSSCSPAHCVDAYWLACRGSAWPSAAAAPVVEECDRARNGENESRFMDLDTEH